jgi:hypothetical protein
MQRQSLRRLQALISSTCLLTALPRRPRRWPRRWLQVLTPRSVLSWQRVRSANLLASSGAQWVELFKRHNSGTYNNQ